MRLQLALNVDDLDASVSFYEKMFGTAEGIFRRSAALSRCGSCGTVPEGIGTSRS